MKLKWIQIIGFTIAVNTSVFSQTIDLSPTDDTELDQATGSTVLGSESYYLIKPWTTSWSSRGVIRFDLSAYSSCTINSAILHLSESHSSGFDRQIEVHRVTSSWQEGTASWNSPWTSPGGDFDATVLVNFDCIWTDNYILEKDEIDLTNSVQDLVNGVYTNHGWLVKMASEDATQQSWGFHSKESSTVSDRPILRITYSGCISLPIELLSFNASVKNKSQIKLTWQTASETNNDFFTIERSKDALNWESIIEIDGAGNSSLKLNYTAVDENPYVGLSYYRLKQTDFDGQYEYSMVEVVNYSSLEKSQIKIYPNPGIRQIAIEGIKSEIAEFQIYNAIGWDVSSLVKVVEQQEFKLTLDISNLPNGIYSVKTKTAITKMFKQ
jgi:hypothetical protein